MPRNIYHEHRRGHRDAFGPGHMRGLWAGAHVGLQHGHMRGYHDAATSGFAHGRYDRGYMDGYPRGYSRSYGGGYY